MEMQANHVWFCIMFILMTFVSHSLAGCTYEVEVATGDRGSAGTDATVSLKLCSDHKDCFLHVSNLAQYGTRGPSYDYFERNNRDFFRIPTKDDCKDVCRMTVSHDNSGSKPGWYVDYVNVVMYDDNAFKQSASSFPVYRWLAKDEPPYTLEEDVNRCPLLADDDHVLSFLLKQHVIA